MADMYGGGITNNNTICSSSSSLPENDDISLFLHQILLRTSSSPSSTSVPSHKMQPFTPLSHFSPENQHRQLPPSFLSTPPRISTAADSPPGPYFPGKFGSGSLGTTDNDPDDYDCESEEGFEALMEEAPVKSNPRNSSKRSRAAEVHNLSEKRRRSRINEKMKALQNLIPNSNKTDKASMLDEAIEYLKQLQLQVQMLTMRNGLSMYPMCLPGVLQPNQQLSQLRMGFQEGNGSLNMTSALPIHPETLTSSVFSPPNQCNNPSQPSVTNLSNIINSKPSFGLVESSTQAQHRSI